LRLFQKNTNPPADKHNRHPEGASEEETQRLGSDDGSSLRIGIPRMFAYYIYPDLWETFFRELGMTPVISNPSTAKTIERAYQISETDHCLPNKLFDAHLDELVGNVDMVFVPRVLSTVKHHLSCPKFGPLPDAARAEIARETEVLSIDINETKYPLSKALMKLGKKLHIKKRIIRSAIKSAFNAMKSVYLEREEQIGKMQKPRFLLIGHQYTLYDNFIAGPILNKLNRMGVDVERISFSDDTPDKSYILWGTANEIYHKLNTLSADAYEGIIQITVFNCGCDSMMIDTYRHLLKTKKVPYMYLMVDEHLSSSGIDTRVEAFIDSLRWRK